MFEFLRKTLSNLPGLKKHKIREELFYEKIKNQGIENTFKELKAKNITMNIEPTPTNLNNYIKNFQSFLTKPPNEFQGIIPGPPQPTTKFKEIVGFIKGLLPDSEYSFFTSKSPIKDRQAKKILDLLGKNGIKIGALKDNLGEDFLKFLNLNDKFFNKYLEELSGLPEELQFAGCTPKLFSEIITQTGKISDEKFKLIIPGIINHLIYSADTPGFQNQNLNKIFLRYVKILKKESKEQPTNDLNVFIEKINHTKILESLELETLQLLVNLINQYNINIPVLAVNNINLEFMKKSSPTINVTTASATPVDSATQEPDDNHFKKIIESIIAEHPEKYELETPSTEEKSSSTSSASYKIKDKSNNVVATFEQTATGSTIKIPDKNTDILVKIIEKLANDNATNEISIGGLSKENVESITKNLEEKINALGEKKQEYQQTLDHLINKLNPNPHHSDSKSYNGNNELLSALKRIKQQHYGISVSAKTLKRLEESTYPPPPTDTPTPEPASPALVISPTESNSAPQTNHPNNRPPL